MATVTGVVTPSVNFTQTVGSGFLSTAPLAVALSLQASLSNGTTADKVDLLYANTLTFTASTPQTLDLTNLTDVIGGAVNFARVRLVIVRVNGTTDAATLTVGAGASNGASNIMAQSAVILRMASTTNTTGAFLILAAPSTTGWVIDGTHKTITLTPSAHAFTADVILAGCSA